MMRSGNPEGKAEQAREPDRTPDTLSAVFWDMNGHCGADCEECRARGVEEWLLQDRRLVGPIWPGDSSTLAATEYMCVLLKRSPELGLGCRQTRSTRGPATVA